VSLIDWRALVVEGEYGKAIYEESFPASLDWALGPRSAARVAFDHEAAHSVLQEYVGHWPDLPEATAPRSDRIVARLLPPIRVEIALLFFAVELTPTQFIVGSCEAFHR
jgi:hypothetical protein